MGSRDPAAADPLARHALSASELKQLLVLERAGDAFLAYRDGER